MIRLIVNADDLGSCAQRDRGIFAAFTRGIVSSASLLANGRNFGPAAHEALACALPIGVHLNLSEGKALTGPIAGLTDAAGNFPGKTGLRRILLAGHLHEAGINRELLAQIERVKATGLAPDHLDTHQHCLLFPALTGIVASTAEASGIRALRLPEPAESSTGNDCIHGPKAGNSTAEGPCHGPADQLAGELALYRQLAAKARRALQARNLWTPDGLWGMPLLNHLDVASLSGTLSCMPSGTWELMTHPGYHDPHDPFGGPEREAELAALTDPKIRQLVVDQGIELTCFGACACAC